MGRFARAVVEALRPLARHLPEPVKRPLRERFAPPPHVEPAAPGVAEMPPPEPATPDIAVARTPDEMDEADYAAKLAAENAIFAEQVEVHDLPEIFHYWSNRWLRPETEAFGFSNPDQFFALHLERTHAELGRPLRIASLGSGNCDTEVRVARLLAERGLRDFVVECVDLNEAMLERGRRFAAESGVAAHVVTRQGDFNEWRPEHAYEAILANQSLHHVVNLEGLFAAIETALVPEGRFVTSDIIGRNGHMRWPEAMEIIHEYWRELPPGHRWNVQLKRHEELLEYWDCSGEGFEGIRAQDILPLLIERFDFELFFAFGNLVDPFIDRSFGPHFDAAGAWDRDFIDRVHRRDEAEMRAGTITPTHMLAVLRRRPYHGPFRCREGLEPARCVRHVSS